MTLQELENLITFVVDEKSKSDVENAMQGIKSTATKLLGAIGITLTLNGVKEFAHDCVQVASDVQEMEGKASVVFGQFADDADAWAESYADSIGRTKSEIKTYITDMQNLLTGFTDGSEEAREACMELSEAATSLAIDNASFDNTEETVSIDRMTKAIMGQTEAARMMGAILDDNTRAEAMSRLEMQGSYKDLDQYNKMLVNYEALRYQMKDAIGDAANSTERYEGKARQLASAQKELKEIVGTGLLPIMTLWNKIQLAVTEGEIKLAKAIFGDTSEESKLQQVTNWLSKAFDRLTEMTNKAREAFTKIADKLGGVENTVKIVTILIGALALVMNFETGVKAVQKVVDVFEKLNKVLGGSKRVMLLAAAITFLALIVEDFVNFMQGNDSLVGELFKKAGIDADEMRQKISDAFTNVGTIVSNIIEGMKEAFDGAFEAVKGFFAAFDIDIGGSLGEAIANLINLVTGFINSLSSSPEKAKSIGKGIVEGLGVVVGLKTAFGVFSGIVKTISTVSKAFGMLKNVSGLFGGFSKAGGLVSGLAKGFLALPGPVKIVIAVIAAVAAAALLIYKNWDKIKPVIDTVIGAFKNFKEAVGNAISGVGETVSNIWGGIVGFFTDTGNSIADTASSVWNGITGTVSSAVESTQNIITTVWTAISGVISTILGAIWSTITSVWNGIYETVKPLLDAIGYLMETLWEAAGVLIPRALDAIWGKITAVWNAVVSFLKPILEAIKNNSINIWNRVRDSISTAMSAVQSVVTSVWNAIVGFIVPLVESIRDKLVAAWNAIKDGIALAIGAVYTVVMSIWTAVSSIVSETVANIQEAVSAAWNAIVTVVTDTLNTIQTTVSDIWNSVYNGVVTKVGEIKSAIETGFNEAVNFITGLASEAFNWGADIIENIKQGIQSKIQEAADAVTGVANTIRSVLHFSEPDEGPLSDFGTYMPDMINLMVEGINAGRSRVKEAAEGVAGQISDTTQNVDIATNVSGASEAVRTVADTKSKIGSVLKDASGSASISANVNADTSALSNVTSLVHNAISSLKAQAGTLLNLPTSVSTQANVTSNAPQLISALSAGIDSLKDKFASVFTSIAAQMPDLSVGASFDVDGANGIVGVLSKVISSLKAQAGKLLGSIAGDLNLTVNPAQSGANGGYGTEATLNGIYSLLNSMLSLVKAGAPMPSTVSTVSSSVSSRNVVQNVTISNKFEGEKTAQKNASRAMDKAAKDVTDRLAHGLAYAR